LKINVGKVLNKENRMKGEVSACVIYVHMLFSMKMLLSKKFYVLNY